MGVTLETPPSSHLIYTSLGEDVDPLRPLFTGDIYQSANDPSELWAVLQHPCALRREGSVLVETILMGRMVPTLRPRSDWSKESFRRMPLPDLLSSDTYQAIDFSELGLLKSEDLSKDYTRIAILSELGVDLLLQRWVHHNSRVVVRTLTFSDQIAGPFAEADLEADWNLELEDLGGEVLAGFHAWIREAEESGQATRQQLLNNQQTRASVRRLMNSEIKRLKAEGEPQKTG